ncbi:centrosomal protein of 89 kDa-like isoform X2 [Mya arenaria]|uniref:centrosomal protein of 89 kDa-like isoform X2 n=1 Tax=Mya arenaria TaxID=6604 RepID=UPI0022E52E8D|nr:centrosomal protein of 89 kDa-like isoform X2 [Mya arenaria]
MARKKGKNKADSAAINPALVPSAAFTVVPRTQAPVPVPAAGLGGSSEVVNASLIGRQPPPEPGPDDELFSDPESSLYDYQNMEEAGYSSVEMLSVSRKRRGREGQLHGLEHDIDEHQHAQFAEAIGSPNALQNPEALYATPMKRGQRQPSTQSLRTTAEVHNAMQRVHELSSDEDSPADRARPTRKQPSARSLHFPVEHETAIKEKAIRSSASTPIATPKSRQPIIVEDRLVQETIEPFHMNRDNLLSASPHEPVSVRSKSALSSRSISEDRLRSLEAERQHLSTLTHQLEHEVQTYREVVSTYESGDSATAQSLLTKKQISDLKEENESLKNSIKRLNVELSAYQAKYRPVNGGKTGDVKGLPSDGPPPSWLQDPHLDHPIIGEFNIRYLNPLFLAYDDRIREREETIKQCQAELDLLRSRTETVVKENEKLHSRLENTALGPIDSTEWEQMKENARLVLEENQNLLEQISVKDEKTHDLHQAHLREVGKLSKQVVILKEEKGEVEKELESARTAQREIKQRHDALLSQSHGAIPHEQHIREIADMKKKLSDADEAHRQELEAVNGKLHASQAERKGLASQVIELTAENKRHSVEARLMHKSVRRAQQKMMFLQRAIEQSENKEMSVQDYMGSLIKVAEKSAFERDTYEKVAKEHELETKKAMKKLMQGNLTVGKMEEKLKLYKMKAAARIGTVAERLKEQEELFNSQKREYEREINHLRNLVREKEDMIQEGAVHKRDLEEQMEAVWQSANSENVRIREEVHKSVHQLRKHTGLSDALDAHDKLDTLHVSSDDEGEKHDFS